MYKPFRYSYLANKMYFEKPKMLLPASKCKNIRPRHSCAPIITTNNIKTHLDTKIIQNYTE